MRLFGFEIQRRKQGGGEGAAPAMPPLYRLQMPDWLFEYFGVPAGGRAGSALRHNVAWIYVAAQRVAIAVAAVPLRLYVVKQSRGEKLPMPTREITKEEFKRLESQASLEPYIRKAYAAKAEVVEEVLEHPALDVIRRVNGTMNRTDYTILDQTFVELTGTAFTYKERDRLGRPIALHPLIPTKVRVVPDEFGRIKHFVMRTGTEKIKLAPDEVIYLRYPDPENPIGGYGPAQAAFMAIRTYLKAAAHEEAVLDNHARPDFVLTTDGDMPPEDELERIRQQLREKHGGPWKAGRPFVASGGLKPVPISWPPKDLGMMQIRKECRELIAAAFGVPLSLLTTEDVNRANAVEGSYTFMKFAIEPRLRIRQEKWNESFISHWGDRLFLAYDDCVPRDREFELKDRESRLRTYLTTINEERARMGLPPVPWGDSPLTPMTIAPLMSPRQAQGEGEAPKILILNAPGQPAELPQASRQAEEGPEQSPEDDRPRWREWADTVIKRRGEDAFQEFDSDEIRELMEYAFRQQAEDIARAIEGRKGIVDPGQIDDWLRPLDAWQTDLAELLSPALVEHIHRGVEIGARDLAIAPSFDVYAPEISEAARTQALTSAGSINATTAKLLRKELVAALEAGEPITKIAAQIRRVMGEIGPQRAVTIARTESTRAVINGQLLQWQRSGVVIGKKWLTAGGACEFCKAIERKYERRNLALAETFAARGAVIEGVEGGTFRVDYEDLKGPPLHPRCRCDLVPIVEGLEEEE